MISIAIYWTSGYKSICLSTRKAKKKNWETEVNEVIVRIKRGGVILSNDPGAKGYHEIEYQAAP